MEYHGIVLVVPELYRGLSEHWLTKVFTIACEYIHKNTDGVVCLVVPQNGKPLYSGVPALATILDVKEEDRLPNLYLMHTKSS